MAKNKAASAVADACVGVELDGGLGGAVRVLHVFRAQIKPHQGKPQECTVACVQWAEDGDDSPWALLGPGSMASASIAHKPHGVDKDGQSLRRAVAGGLAMAKDLGLSAPLTDVGQIKDLLKSVGASFVDTYGSEYSIDEAILGPVGSNGSAGGFGGRKAFGRRS